MHDIACRTILLLRGDAPVHQPGGDLEFPRQYHSRRRDPAHRAAIHPFKPPPLHTRMIRLRPYEWLHMEVPGSGRVSESRVSGTLYITPHRIAIQGKDGPAWSAPVRHTTVSKDGRISSDGVHHITWKSKIPVDWWGNAVMFWKRGILYGVKQTHGPPPAFGNVAELPEVLARHPQWNIRWYNRMTLATGGLGKPEETEEFNTVSRHTNMILAALRHDGYPRGPPPAYMKKMIARHALTHITHMVWGWKNGLRYISDVISGRGHRAQANRKAFPFADWTDRWYEHKPYRRKREWYHEINASSCGGSTYQIYQTCHTMIPIISRVADELHENPTHNPYLRMQMLYESIRDNKPVPPPPREALPLARAAANDPW